MRLGLLGYRHYHETRTILSGFQVLFWYLAYEQEPENQASTSETHYYPRKQESRVEQERLGQIVFIVLSK